MLAEEMLPGDAEDAVHTVVARYAKSGELEAVADVPIGAVAYLPNRYGAISAEGRAYFLEPTAREVRVLELSFVKCATISLPEEDMPGTRGAGRAAPPLTDDGFEGFVRGLYADDEPTSTRGAGAGITRARILENAPGYLYCITPEATGVDCSGFVSRALEEKYYTTSTLHQITDRLPSLRELKPGDILNHAGSHVRLFVGFAEGGPLAVRTIESAVSCGGICEATYTVSKLAKYVPLRYRYVQD